MGQASGGTVSDRERVSGMEPEPRVFARRLPLLHRVGWWLAAVLSFPATGVGLYLTSEHVDLRSLAAQLPGGELTALAGFVTLFGVAFAGPVVSLMAYLAWIQRRYGSCRLEGGKATFRVPLLPVRHVLRVEELGERRVTPYGLRLRHPLGGPWLLLPTEGEAEAGQAARLLDRLGAQELPPPQAPPDPQPPGSGIRTERWDGEVRVLVWDAVAKDRLPLALGVGLLLIPLFGVGLLILLGIALRRPYRLTFERERLRLTSPLPRWAGGRGLKAEREELQRVLLPGRRTLWVVDHRGRRSCVVDGFALCAADTEWLYRVLRAWQAGALFPASEDSPAG